MSWSNARASAAPVPAQPSQSQPAPKAGWSASKPGGTTTTSSSVQSPASPVSPRSTASPVSPRTTAPSTSSTPSAQAPRPAPAPKSGGWAQAQVSRPQPTPQAQVSQSELKSADATTARMLAKLELTQDMADLTLAELDEQNRKITAMQDDMAEVHDDLDTSSRKLTGISNFWGNYWGKKKHNERHQKARGEYEKEMAKDAMKAEAQRQHAEQKAYAQEEQTHMAQMARALNDPSLHADLRRQEKADRKQPPPQRTVQDEPITFQSGDFVFEEREDGFGEQVQAEEDLERIHEHVQGLKTKAWTMGNKVDESSKRLDNLHSEVDRADERTNKNIKRGNKIIG